MSRTVQFSMERREVEDLVEALKVVAWVAGESEIESDAMVEVDVFVNTVASTLRSSTSPMIDLRLTEATWRALLYANEDLALNCEDDSDPRELKAIHLVEVFLVASGRKLGTSIFRSPEDRRAIEEASGVDLEHLDL